MKENIKRLRKEAGFTQGQIAELLSVGQNTVSMWETGCAKPSVDKLPMLAKILGCTIDELYAEAK